MEVEHLIFLIHPCCYEALEREVLLRGNMGIYVEREREVKQRWLAALGEQTKATLLLQLYGPESLFEVARERLGPPNACFVRAEFPGGEQMPEYYRRLTECIREHLREFELSFDPAEVTSETWGESFEGCASLYSSAFAELLALKRPPRMRFEMTVYDSRFLYGCRSPEAIRLPGTDIEAMLFELYDRTGAAIFQARLTAQYLDRRPIRLALDPARTFVCTTTGVSVWPKEPPIRALPQEPQPFVLATSSGRWVRATAMPLDELRKVVSSAEVGERPTQSPQSIES